MRVQCSVAAMIMIVSARHFLCTTAETCFNVHAAFVVPAHQDMFVHVPDVAAMEAALRQLL